MSNYILPKSNFIHIPKCGGTTVNTTLWRVGCMELADQPLKNKILRKPNYGHLFASQMPENGMPFFTFVRHPVSWWVSFYHWNRHPSTSRFSGQELECVSFEEWANSYGQFWFGLYSTLVARYIGDDPNFPTNNKVTLFGKVENLFVDLKNILDTLGERYKADIMQLLIDNTLELTNRQTNKQTYKEETISESTRATIMACEHYVASKFDYK